MSVTRGGERKRKRFDWHFDRKRQCVVIENENGKEHLFTVSEIEIILNTIYERFGDGYFPLANNVAKLGNGTERMGLGTIIFEKAGRNVTHAQGASYLGVVLEETGYLRWNGKHKGIEWRLQSTDFQLEIIESRLTVSRNSRYLLDLVTTNLSGEV